MSFKLFGVECKVSYVFVLSLTLFILFDKSGNFLPFVASVFIHELSHIIFMFFFGAKPKEISLSMGTINIKNNHILTLSEEITILLVGPLSNLFLYTIFSNFKLNENFANINLILFIMNILCVEGLDGGAILKAILNNFSNATITNRILFVIKILNLSAIFTFFLFCLKHNFINYTLLFFIFYILIKR